MRASLVVGLVVSLTLACAHDAPPATTTATGPTPCARAADHMVQTMLARLASNEAAQQPTEAADAMRNLIRERCERDAWSREATECLIAMKSQDEAARCATFMTDTQQAALVRDEQAAFGPPAAP